MASAEDVGVALKLAERALDEIRFEPGFRHFQSTIERLRSEVGALRALAASRRLPERHSAIEFAANEVVAAVGRLMPPSIEEGPEPAIVPQVNDLANSLRDLRFALSDPTTDPNLD